MSYNLCDKARQLEPYDPVEGTYRVRLDANESFLLPTVSDREAMADIVQGVAFNRYPDPLAHDLCAAFGKLYGVDPALVTAGNGSDELISVIFSTFLQKGDTVLTVAPDFSMYRFYTSITENPCLTLQKDADMRIDVDEVIATIREKGVRLFIFSNPCNPTSVGLDRDSVRRIIRETDALIVLDEAYMDFWDQSLLDEVAAYDNLIILRTCSKMLGMAALPLALTIDRFTNGLTRPLFGFISDRFGREQTMFIAFALEGVAMMLWLACREDPLLFVLLSGVVFFGWGEIFSLFPSTLTDTFGSEHAATNYGWLYISQGIGSIFGGPLAALLYQYTHGWHLVFSCAIGLDFVTAALALWVLKPWRARFIRQHS